MAEVNVSSPWIIDTFAIMAYLKDEPGADMVADLFAKANRRSAVLLMHAVNVGEVYYALARHHGELAADQAYSVMKRYPITYLYEMPEDLLLTAARLKARYAVSYADCFAVATALTHQGRLVSGDPDLAPLIRDQVVQVIWPHR